MCANRDEPESSIAVPIAARVRVLFLIIRPSIASSHLSNDRATPAVSAVTFRQTLAGQ